ncbi:MAG: amidohydrolase, partial [Gemmatimonadales bacterium]
MSRTVRHLALGALLVGLATPLLAQPRPDSARRNKAGLPLSPGRTFRQTLSHGTWMSVDVSPDGRTLVFDLLGDLYTLPIGGGRATRLTSGLAYDAQPRWSPDGRRIVFTSDRSGGDNVWIIEADGSDSTQVTKGNNNGYISPEWAPDGQYLVVTKTGGGSGGNKLWLYHQDGGAGVQLVQGSNQLTTIGAAFGPDPRYVWFATRQGSWSYNAILPEFQLAMYDRVTGSQTTMSSRYGSAFRPALSPDGKWLAYATRHDAETGLRLRDLATGSERWLAYPVQRDNQEAYPDLDVLPGYAFTPDSRELVVSYGGELWRVPVDGSAARKIPFTADVEVPLGPELRFDYTIADESTLVARQIRDPVPTPDGRRLAFSALNHLWVMDQPEGTPRRVTAHSEGEFFPTWSPDGRWLAFVTWSGEGGHLYKAPVDGGGAPVRL